MYYVNYPIYDCFCYFLFIDSNANVNNFLVALGTDFYKVLILPLIILRKQKNQLKIIQKHF
jgi:hypothetical protein